MFVIESEASFAISPGKSELSGSFGAFKESAV